MVWDLEGGSKGVRKRQDKAEGVELWGARMGMCLCPRELVPAQGHGRQLRPPPTWELSNSASHSLL